MDQFIRKLGPHRTHYALGAESARTFLQGKSSPIDVVIVEYDLPDATAFRFIRDLREDRACDHLYYILAVEENSEPMKSLADEMEVDSILIKPFNANDLAREIETYVKRREDQKSPESLVKLAQFAFRDKNFLQSEKLYKAALDLAPDSPRILAKMAQYLILKPDLALAEKYLKKALEIDPHHLLSLQTLGTLALRKKDFQGAFRVFTKAQEYSPLNPDRPAAIARMQIAWAAETLRSATLQDPKNNDLHYELGRLAVLQRDYTLALRELRAACIPEGHPQYAECEALIQLVCKLGSLR